MGIEPLFTNSFLLNHLAGEHSKKTIPKTIPCSAHNVVYAGPGFKTPSASSQERGPNSGTVLLERFYCRGGQLSGSPLPIVQIDG